MGSYKRPRVFDPLDLEIIDLVYEAALVQITAREPLSDPAKEVERQEEIKKLVFAVAKPSAVDFDDLLDKVLDHLRPNFSTPRRRRGHGQNQRSKVAGVSARCRGARQQRERAPT